MAVADAPGLDAEHRGGGELEAAAAQGVAEDEGDPQAIQAVGCEGQGEPAEVGGDEQARGGAGIEAEAEAGAAQTRPREAEAEAGVEQGADGDVVRKMETDLSLVECFTDTSRCLLTSSCKLRGVLDDALEAFFASLDKETLVQLLGPAQRQILFMPQRPPVPAADRGAPADG